MPVLAALLLAAAALLPQDADRSFSFPEGNYKIVLPKGWVKIKNQTELYQLSLLKGGNFVGISGFETEAGAEAILKTIEDGQKQQDENYRTLGRAVVKVAGVRALQLRGRMKREGLAMTVVATVFTHQGCAYRFIGVYALGSFAAFEEEYQALLLSFAFLGDRKEWLDRFEGKPARTQILGGLCGFELNRPRWIEITLQEQRNYQHVETASFRFMGQGAWIYVRARLTAGTLAGELEHVRQDLAGRLRKPVVQAAAFKGKAGDIPGFEITGEYNGEPYFMHSAVLLVDGVCVDFYLEGYEPQKEITRRDWEQLLAGFTLQSRTKPARPLAYPLRSWDESKKSDPALSAILEKAARVPGAMNDVVAVSPDGARVLLAVREEGNEFLDTATGKREKAGFEQVASSPVRWSRDGKRIVWATDEGVCLATVNPPALRVLGVRGTDVAFGATEPLVLVCAGDRERARIPVSRLELAGPGDERNVLVDFPLSRVSCPDLSPDGKRLALVTNRDCPRTETTGGHLYVGGADGKDLRKLTDGPEEIHQVAWSADGKVLYVVRRLSRGRDGAVGTGGRTDLWKVSAATGDAINLTRCGELNGAWIAGDEAFLWFRTYRVPESQQGLFRIGLADLEKASASLPERPVHDAAANARLVSTRVRAALGNGPIREVVPTPAGMAAAAKAFAAAVKESSGVTLDFSRGSLDEISSLLWSLDLRDGDPALILGIGAYYGETLKAVAGAEWMLQPVPFGDASPALRQEGTPLAQAVLPFSDPLAHLLGSEERTMMDADEVLRQDQGRKLLLVHPPSHAAAAVKAATGPAYYEAKRKLDAGEVRPALDLLIRELERRPKNRTLALEVIGFCDAARLPDEAKALTRKAVEAGNEVPELLMRYAEDLASSEPEKAREALRKAAHGDYPPPAVFLRLGKAYAAAGDRPLAEACWRRAFDHASPVEKGEIHSLMGTSKAAQSDE